jgi:polyisoprenoid-binding protein YceI
MVIGRGTYRIGPDTGGRVTLRTGRDGFGAMVGHDLVLEATRWRGTVDVDPDEPGRSQVEVTVEAGSLEVVRGEGGIKPLTDKDRNDIRRTIREQLLRTARYPDIVFRSTETAGTDRALCIRGDLTVAGQTRPVTLAVSVREEAGALVATATTTIVQTAFRIKPYSALMGALRVRDSVDIHIEATLRDGE